MSEKFKQQTEVIKQDIENQSDPIKKVSKYQDLANKALENFYSSVDKLVSGSKKGQLLKQLAYDRVVKMNEEIQSRLDQIKSSSGLLGNHNERMLDLRISDNVQLLIRLGSATKESLDDLINTGGGILGIGGDKTGKYRIDNQIQLSQALDEIMKVDFNQTGNILADKAEASSSKKNTIGLGNIKDYRRGVTSRTERAIEEATK